MTNFQFQEKEKKTLTELSDTASPMTLWLSYYIVMQNFNQSLQVFAGLFSHFLFVGKCISSDLKYIFSHLTWGLKAELQTSLQVYTATYCIDVCKIMS